MATLYLVRHGRASFGTTDYDRLSAIGIRQARLAGRYLQRAIAPVNHVISGSLTRQRHTAQEIANALSAASLGAIQITIDERFNELDIDSQIECIAPQLEGPDHRIADLTTAAKQSSRAYQALVKEVFVNWQTHNALPNSVETWTQFCERLNSAVSDIQCHSERGRDVVVVTSGGVIANIVRMVLDLPPSATYSLFEVMMNCSVTRLLYNRTRISLSSLNECSYLWADEEGHADLRLLTFR